MTRDRDREHENTRTLDGKLGQRIDLRIGDMTGLTLLNIRWIVHSQVIVLVRSYAPASVTGTNTTYDYQMYLGLRCTYVTIVRTIYRSICVWYVHIVCMLRMYLFTIRRLRKYISHVLHFSREKNRKAFSVSKILQLSYFSHRWSMGSG